MAKIGRERHTLAQSFTRRKLLFVAGASVLPLAACGDESSDREFAGDPRTHDAETAVATAVNGVGVAGSPIPVSTALPVRELLRPRGVQTAAIVSKRHELIVVDVKTGVGTNLWANQERAIWAAELDPRSARVALLTSAADSATDWAIEFVGVLDGTAVLVPIGNDVRSGPYPDAVAAGRGGIDWLPDAGSVTVALPTGGLIQVFPDGSEVRLARAAIAKRPAAIAVAPDGNALAFVEQPSDLQGSGIYAGSMRAKPIDPIVVLPPDPSGNRYARGVRWIGSSAWVATILEREELGNPQGDLFYLDTHTKALQLAWTSPRGRDVASVESFEISDDALVTAFVTSPSLPGRGKPSSLWLKQTDGPSIERFDLPARISDPRISFVIDGLALTGFTGGNEDENGLASLFLLAPNGEVHLLFQEAVPGTPIASPAASPAGTPLSSPVASPSVTENGTAMSAG